MATFKEILPKSGLLSYEFALQPILCKPKLLPLKSVTLEKLEKMQHEAQEKVIAQQREEAGEVIESEDGMRAMPEKGQPPAQADIWRAEDEPSDSENDLIQKPLEAGVPSNEDPDTL